MLFRTPSLFLVGACLAAPAATLTENFDNVAGLGGLGWVIVNNSSPIGTIDYFQGNSAVFVAHQGAAEAYAGVNHNSVNTVGDISTWLLTPEVTLANGDTFSFWSRTVDSRLFADRLELRLSTSGASTNVGSSTTSVGDFTTLLLTINSGLTVTGYPNSWTNFVATVSGLGAPTTGRFAFRYSVPNGGSAGANSDYIGIDTVELASAVPEPSTWIAGLSALAVIAARRRVR